MTIFQTEINQPIENYILQHSQFNNTDLDFIFNSAQQFYEPNMQISKIQATALQFFIQTNSIRNIVEIGSFVGYSAFVMAKSIPIKGKITSIEKNQSFYNQAKENQQQILKKSKSSYAFEKINFLHGDAKNILSQFEKNSSEIDMIFLDGDKKHYPHYLNWATQYLRVGAYLFVDNVFFKGNIITNEKRYSPSIKTMTKNLKKDQNFNYFFLTVGDGMLVAKKQTNPINIVKTKADLHS